MSDTTDLGALTEASARMRRFVDGGDWRSAPWAEGHFTEHFIESIKNCSLFLDIGAEIGFYSYLAVKYMPSGGQVIAFEPDPQRAAALKGSFASLSHVRIAEVAADKIATIREFVRPFAHDFPCPTSAQIEGEKFQVETVRLDDFLGDDRVGVIKMDIEGAEVNALQGMKQILRRDRPRIYFEIHPFLISRIETQGLPAIERLFADCGYRFFNGDYDGFVPTSRLVGARLYACHESDVVSEKQQPQASGLTALRVHMLHWKRLARERVRGY